MNLELEFSNKVDLKALNLTIEDINKDIKLLDNWGFDFNRNILTYIHEMAETMRYIEKHEDYEFEKYPGEKNEIRN